jgi:hypothetical protein
VSPTPVHRLVLRALPGRHAVARLGPRDALPAWLPAAAPVAVTRTDRELSIVCEAAHVPADVRAETGFRAFAIEGTLDFALTGVVAALTAPLAAEGVPVFVLSTYDTDLLLLRDHDVVRARAALAAAGHVLGGDAPAGAAGAEFAAAGEPAPPARPPAPAVEALVAALDRHGVRYVITGSVAARLHGAPVERPGDLDIVPDLGRDNLERLAAALVELAARPAGGGGQWQAGADGERRWIAERETAAAVSAPWAPDPERPATLDHLFATAHGALDVVPELAGRYEDLAPRARALEVGGHRVWIAPLDDLLARLTVPRRGKDRARVQALRALQRQGSHPPAARGEAPQ